MINLKSVISAAVCCAVAAGLMTGCEKSESNGKKVYINGESSSETSVSEALEETNENSETSEKTENPEITNIGSEKLLSDMAFKLDGDDLKLHKLPFSELSERGWNFVPELYGLQDLSAKIGEVYSRSVYLEKEGYDPEVCMVGFTNYNEEPCGLDEIGVWSLEFTCKDKTNFPDVVLDGGITWGASKDDLFKAYGTPTNAEKREESYVISYKNADDFKFIFEIYDDIGLGKITMEAYKL